MITSIYKPVRQKKKPTCPKCGEILLYWELTSPTCGTCIRIPENDHINYPEKSEYPAPAYRAE